MSTSIWNAAAGTPTASHRVPVDTASSGGPTRYTVQQFADLTTSVGCSVNALGSIGTNTSIDLSLGGFVSATITGNLTFSFINPAAGGTEFTLVLTNGGAHTITWPASVTWAGETAPTLTASGVDVLHFTSGNGGTNWYGWHEVDVPVGTTAGTVAAGDDSRIVNALSQPLTTTRATRQTSAASAAASGEIKFQARDVARFPMLDLISDVSDPLLLFPSTSDPLVSGWWAIDGTTAYKGLTTATPSGTVTSSNIGTTIAARNCATAASANTYAGFYVFSNIYREGSSTGDGYFAWGLTSTPDASYGSGATGCVINMGMDQAGGAVNGNRPSARCAMLQYNTNQSDVNWQLLVHNGTTLTTVDTGLAFSAQGIWLWAIHVPRGGSATYAYIKNLATGASGSATASATSGSTALYFMPAWICTLTTTARNVRFASAFVRHGGVI